MSITAAMVATFVLATFDAQAHSTRAHAARLSMSVASPTPTPSASPTGNLSPTPSTPTSPDPALTPPPPTPTSPPPSAPGTQVGGCGWLDVGCKVSEAINTFFKTVVTSALNPVFRFLASTVLAAPRVDQFPRVHSLWTTLLWIANTCFVLLVILGGILLMGHQSVQTSYTIKDVAPRLVVAVIAANANLPVIGQLIDVAHALSVAVMGNGITPSTAAETLKGVALTAVGDPGFFLPLLGLVAVVVGIIVMISCVFRIMALVLLTAIAPLALACHALPHTEELARLWWRATAGVLATGVAQALVLSAAVRVFFAPDRAHPLWSTRSPSDAFELVLVICLLYIMARIPSYIAKMTTRGGMSNSPIVRGARTIAAIWIFRNIPTPRRRPRPRPRPRPR